MSKEGASVSRPPLLDGLNYTYWKMKMRAFIMSIDEEAWSTVEEEWKKPIDDKGDKKAKSAWSVAERRAATGNSKALNAIFSAVTEDQFKLISTCETAFEAWETLAAAHEGSASVRKARLHQIMSRFDTLKMTDEESIGEYHARMKDITNQAYLLGRPIPELEMVRKLIRTAHKKFRSKLGALELLADYETMRLEEIVGILQAEEMILDEYASPKGLAMKADDEEEDDDSDYSDEEVSSLTKKLARMLRQKRNKQTEKNQNPKHKQFQNGSSSGVQTERRQQRSGVRIKKEEKGTTGGIKCYECGGIGHIRAECATYKKKENKSYKATWSDNSDDEQGIVAFMAYDDIHSGNSKSLFNTFSETNDDDCSDVEVDVEKLIEIYHRTRANLKKVNAENKRVGQFIDNMEKQIDDAATENKTLTAAIKVSEEEILKLKKERDAVLTVSKQATDRSNKLEETVKELKKQICDLNGERDTAFRLSRQACNTTADLEAELKKIKSKGSVAPLLSQGVNIIAILKEERDKAVTEYEKLKASSTEVETKLIELKQSMSRLNTGKANLDDVLAMGKTFGDHTGIGYRAVTTGCSNNRPTRTFVKGGVLTDLLSMKVRPATSRGKGKWRFPRPPQTCSYCALLGHTTEKCLKLARDVIQGKPVAWPSEEIKKQIKYKPVWIRKDEKEVRTYKEDFTAIKGPKGVGVDVCQDDQTLNKQSDIQIQDLDGAQLGKLRHNLGLCVLT